MRIAFAAAALAVLTGGAMAHETMSAERLAAAITGKSYTGVDPDTGEEIATVVYATDGSSVLTFPDGREEAGSWRLDDDAYCTRYAAFRDNSENCFRLEPIADGEAQAWYTDGRRALILRPAD